MTLKALSAAIAVSMVSLGCTQQSPSTENTDATGDDALGAATVQAADGREIKESLVRYYALNGLQKPLEQLTPEERTQIVDSLADLDALAEAAEDRGLAQERTVAVELELQRQQVLARTMVTRYVEENPPTDAELQAEYDANLSQFETVEHKARHILVESQEEANALIEQLDAGADFGELAEEHSIDPAASNGGGDLGWFASSSMVAPFAEAVETMEVGTHSATPVETQFGWHVILLEDQRTSEPPPLDTVRADLSNQITERKVQAYIDSLRSDGS
jgi:peptidyl-prolyl cis-trans isomerase C